MHRIGFDFDVITGPSSKTQEDQRQPPDRKDWDIAASLRTAKPAAAQAARTTGAADARHR